MDHEIQCNTRNNRNYSGHGYIDYKAIVATMTKIKLTSTYLMNNNILFRFLSNLFLVYIYPNKLFNCYFVVIILYTWIYQLGTPNGNRKKLIKY